MKYEFIQNNRKYWKFILELRNHPLVKTGFIQQRHVTNENHTQYMEKYSDNYFLCLIDNIPAGYVGVVDDDIRVATHPEYQGRGVGKFMINEIMKIFPNSCAKVKIENTASLKLFEACGFEKKYYLLERE